MRHMSSAAMEKKGEKSTSGAFRAPGIGWIATVGVALFLWKWHEKYVDQSEAMIPSAMPEQMKQTAVSVTPKTKDLKTEKEVSKSKQTSQGTQSNGRAIHLLSVAQLPVRRMAVASEQPAGRSLEIETCIGDITDDDSDAMVNSCDSKISYFGDIFSGMSYSLAKKGGKELQDLSEAWVREHGPLEEMQTAIHPTTGKITSKWLISVRMPTWKGGNRSEAIRLEQSVKNVLHRANEQKLESVVMGPLSVSVISMVPSKKAAQITFNAIRKYAQENSDKPNYITRVRVINTDSKLANTYSNQLEIMKKKWEIEEQHPQKTENA